MAKAETVWHANALVIEATPLRRLVTPGRLRMSVAMTNSGRLDWLSDRWGYRYDSVDPDSGHAWPPIPAAMQDLAREAAAAAGFPGFDPDACLVKRYEPGARLSLHQDRGAKDLGQPIVCQALGLPAVFQFGGVKRNERTVQVPLVHGDVVVWAGPPGRCFTGCWRSSTGGIRWPGRAG
jgi:alkylated DNA repair protein (DNA oxidative demethylase)